MLKKAWRGWLKVAETLGNIQMIFLLSLIYWTIWALIAIPFKYRADPLALRRPGGAGWVLREPGSQSIESMRKQG